MADDLAPAQTDDVVAPPAEVPVETPVETPVKVHDPFDGPFIDPSELPDELKPHWKAMHRAHTKRIESLRAHEQDVAMLERFRSDPAYAAELLRFEAQRLGFQISQPGQQAAPPPSSPTSGASPDLVEAVKARLDPSMHWLAESLASAASAAAEARIKPIVEKTKASELAARESEWGALAGKLTETAPGWEAHENDMTALLDWLRSPSLKSDQWGDKLTFLFNAVTNGSHAKAAAIRTMAEAARNATRTGQTGRATQPNIGDRVLKAKTNREAVQVAAEEAIREMRERGIAIPE